MKRLFIVTLALFAPLAHCEYVGLYSGIKDMQHQYLQESASLQEQMYGGDINMQTYRVRPLGWFARGPWLNIQQSLNDIAIDSHISLYQSFLHQGFWFQLKWQNSQFETEIEENQVYINQSGVAQALSAGDVVGFERQYLMTQVYWYESLKDEGPINTVGLFYSIETSPASSSISTTNATIFDGRFSGFGFTFGRKKDDRGLNFQWRLTLAQLDTDFSNNATGHRNLSELESTLYQVKLSLDWHYRYYLGPYWYLVPSAHVRHENLLQSQLDPQFVEHDRFSLTQLSVLIGIRRYF